jgi:hypothetical protein
MKIATLLSLVAVTILLTASLPAGAQQPVAPPPPQIPYGAPISLEQAKKVLAGAEAEAKKNNWNMVIAVLDSGGHLVMLERMDSTQLGSIDAAKDKAYSAVLYWKGGSRSSWTGRSSAPSAYPAPPPSRMRRSPRRGRSR